MNCWFHLCDVPHSSSLINPLFLEKYYLQNKQIYKLLLFTTLFSLFIIKMESGQGVKRHTMIAHFHEAHPKKKARLKKRA
jgi:hypothetical protein